jgi:precorrin-6A/cobalt-precorrin-6A reductase
LRTLKAEGRRQKAEGRKQKAEGRRQTAESRRRLMGNDTGGMILLLGGTSETAPLATALARAGHSVLVSTATNIALDVGSHAKIRRRSGRLDVPGMIELIRRESISAIVDAAHPYATAAHATARDAAHAAGIRCLTYTRPVEATPDAGVRSAADHEEAARLACEAGGPILLTTGSRNLAPYVAEARRRSIALFVRVLPEAESLSACRDAGVAEAQIVAARGPFSVEENRALIRRFGIKTLVTKESGTAGGFGDKIEATRLEQCSVVVVRRPAPPSEEAFSSIEELVHALKA